MIFSAKIVDIELARSHGLTDDEYNSILNLINRKPTITELGVFSAMWNEHCSYKSTKKWLRTLPTKGSKVICGPGENAGIIDIGDGDALVFKIESHNHPSYIDPFQGSATGVGGILRDIFTMGARPIATMNALSFGCKDKKKVTHLLSEVIKGIGSYGNSFGVPNLGGELRFDESYEGNCLVNVFAAGLVKSNKIFYSGATSTNLPVVYLGAKTGRDGIGGATMASSEFISEKEAERPAVQIGDPFMEKCLLEACLELMEAEAVISIQDMGAAGLTCSAVEMAGKGKLGMILDLNKVPTRESEMHAYEMMLSESQERMLMTLKPGKEKIARAIFKKWDLDFAIVGKTIKEDRFKVFHNSNLEVDLPLQALSTMSPEYDRKWRINQNHIKTPSIQKYNLQPLKCLTALLSSPNYSSRKIIWEQFDHMVMANTVRPPGSNAGVIRIPETNKAIACSLDCTPRYCSQDPHLGGKQAVTEGFRNLIITGASPLAITNNLNFGNPEKTDVMGQIVGCIQGISEASIALDLPVVSGNVSLYNETDGIPILATPTIGTVGLIKSIDDLILIKATTTDCLYLIGDNPGHLGQSSLLREILGISGKKAGPAPEIEFSKELDAAKLINELNAEKKIVGGHDISDGGLMLATAEICILNNLGIKIDASESDICWLFGEDQGLYLLVCEEKNQIDLEQAARRLQIPCQKLGTFGEKLIEIGNDQIPVSELKKLHETGLDHFFSASV
ncbi:MAG: phosphoribosylformylglycinamidine synthase subunit PurL [Paracoccaceae bacterium]|nr:phosphoribosylformylglycinamidine synthase subunit PurL [Paracoccaceae bacterium]